MNNLRSQILKNINTIGVIATSLAVIMFVALIEVFISNIKGESHIIIQPMMTALAGLIWTLYGYGKKDWFIMIPNITGLVLGVATTIAAFI